MPRLIAGTASAVITPRSISKSRNSTSSIVVAVRASISPTIRPRAHQVGALREAEHFLDLGGDEQHRRAAGGELDDEVVDAPARADVDAARRLVEEHDARLAEHPLRQEHLLLVAAGIERDAAVDRGAA